MFDSAFKAYMVHEDYIKEVRNAYITGAITYADVINDGNLTTNDKQKILQTAV